MTFWSDFKRALEAGEIRPLTELTRFGQVLNDTVSALGRVLDSQRRQRREAARRARVKAEQLRLEKEARERERLEAEARRKAQQEREQNQARERARQEEAARLEAARVAAREQAMAEVDTLGPGSWIALKGEAPDEQEKRLKLAVRINARQKLVFVDRLGLNRTELTNDQLVDHLLAGTARILGASAEFDETLSRVVGRIRVGR